MTKPKRLNDEKIFRYWVEVREHASGLVRKLPLTAVRLVCLKTGKKNEPLPPDRGLLRMQDGEETWEASDFDELKTPDSATNIPMPRSSAPCISCATRKPRSDARAP
jgi:hypothetical protein